ncbi:MAG: Gfo/Idh/MocA family oxidoreductase [Candidatus Latescibacteria bacterium]|nr:Gfo/Idh/MocA family oxidoreductase [Candidatus Latescibacterota bacterium]
MPSRTKTSTTKPVIRCGIIGYGGAFNMGKAHAGWIKETDGLELAAVCDIDPTRTDAARQDFPGIATYNRVDDLLARSAVDLCTIVLPHNLHAPVAIQCLNAGRHAIVEKPMCISVKEATAMIETAKKAKRMLSVFHNRRFDGDFMAIKEVIDKGLIGQVFHVEAGGGGYGHPGRWWRAEKKISGGAFYDWGAHIVDWMLHFLPGRIVGINGYFQKLKWFDATNEDHVQAVFRFDTGAVGEVQLSHLARVGRARWRILGTEGGILDTGGESFKVVTDIHGIATEMTVRYKKGDWPAYYKNIVGHLLRGEPLAVTPESARRVIAVMETAEKSHKSGKTEKVPYE